MKKIRIEELTTLIGGVIDMATYCDKWTGLAYEAIQFNDEGTRSDLLYIAMYMMAAGKCENAFTNY